MLWVTCITFLVKVIDFPDLIKESDIAPAMYPEIAIVPHGTALNHAACFKFTLKTYSMEQNIYQTRSTIQNLEYGLKICINLNWRKEKKTLEKEAKRMLWLTVLKYTGIHERRTKYPCTKVHLSKPTHAKMLYIKILNFWLKAYPVVSDVCKNDSPGGHFR